MPIQQLFLGTGAGGDDPIYIQDVFSTTLYSGDGTNSRQIVNNIDLAGKGGAVLTAVRNAGQFYSMANSVRGATKFVYQNGSNIEQTGNERYGSFNSDGYTLGSNSNNNYINASGTTFCSYTWRKAKGFFTCVSYTGTGSAQAISHDLDSVPGFIAIKNLSRNEDWGVYHRGNNQGTNPENYGQSWNTPNAWTQNWDGLWNNTAPTSTQFTVLNADEVNKNGDTYIAYLWAHDDQRFGADADSSLIKCGHYIGNGNNSSNLNSTKNIDLGWEPQFVMIKNTNEGYAGYYFDSMRGIYDDDETDKALQVSPEYGASQQAEIDQRLISLTSTGFALTSNDANVNENQGKYVYIAIRRPDAKVGKSVVDLGGVSKVFAMARGNSSTPSFVSNFPVDFQIYRPVNTYGNWQWGLRRRGPRGIESNSSGQQNFDAQSSMTWDHMNGIWTGKNGNPASWMFRNAPGFMDTVTFWGTESNQTISHNLGVVPQMILFFCGDDFCMYHYKLANTSTSHGSQDPADYLLRLSYDNKPRESESNNWFNGTAPTATAFTVGSNEYNNKNNSHITAVLFASVDGVCSIGSYRGTSSSTNIRTVTTGFTPRFIFTKRFDSGNEGHQASVVNNTSDTGLPPSPSTDGTPTWRWENQFAGSSSRNYDPISTGFRIVNDISTFNSAPAPGWYTNYVYWAMA